MKNLFKFALFLLFFSGLGIARADVVVVVSKASGVSSLTKDQVSDIFLGKTPSFPDGSQAVPVDQAEGAAQREEFHGKVTGKNGVQLKAYWSRRVFSGVGSAPKEVPGAADVKKLVAANPNMIGYVDKATLDGSLKAVFSP